MSKHELLAWSPSSLPHNINCTHLPSPFSAELLLLSSTTAGKPHEVTFPHTPHITVPGTLLFPYNAAYLCEEENVAQLFISSEGSAKSSSNISREALVLKVASSCWADVPVRKHIWQWERHNTRSSNCKCSTRRGRKTSSFQKRSWDGVQLLFLLLRCSSTQLSSPWFPLWVFFNEYEQEKLWASTLPWWCREYNESYKGATSD